MKFDDIYVKNLIKEYQIDLSDDTVYKFQEYTYHYVKNWPKMRYRCDEDICQDFVLYVLDYTKQILNSFPLHSSVKFSTWFSATLFNKFCDFTKSGDVNTQNIDADFEMIAVDSNPKSDTDSVVDKLSPLDRSLWLFCYAPQEIDSDLLLELVDYTQKPLQEILLLHQESLKIEYSCFQLRETYTQKLDKIEHKLSHYQNIIDKHAPNEILEQKILRLKNRRYKYNNTLKMIDKKLFKVFVKLFKDYDQAYRELKKIKLKLKIFIHEDYGDK